LNARNAAPTLEIGDNVVNDTIWIVNKVQPVEGPDLSGNRNAQAWLLDIMAVHYGALLYRTQLDADGTESQIIAHGRLPGQLNNEHPVLSDVIAPRLDGNRRV